MEQNHNQDKTLVNKKTRIVNVYDDVEKLIKKKEELTEDEKKELEKKKIKGDKHKLKKDNIFIKNNQDDDDEYYDNNFVKPNTQTYHGIYIEEMQDQFSFNIKMDLQDFVYNTLKTKTNYAFPNVKRKPSKANFNSYFEALIKNKDNNDFLSHELFLELAYYFTNTGSKDRYNSVTLNKMFELLDKKWAILIMNELVNKTNKKKLLDYFNEINNDNKCV